ncbi:hypothetical protein WKG92_19835 [Pantoea agglomerans]|uniref:hypothetical protein n=1 Tax=Enterobacter agglomerans TaxID=549 RepID=UPI003C7A6D0E
MSITGNVVNFFVAVATAHDVSNPIGSWTNGSYLDSFSGLYWGDEIFRHPKTVATLAKYGAIEYFHHPDHGEVICFDDRREVLGEFSRGYSDAEDGLCTEDGALDSAMPHAYLAGAQFYRMRSKVGGMAFRLDQGRVCHGVVCEDTGEKWTQD